MAKEGLEKHDVQFQVPGTSDVGFVDTAKFKNHHIKAVPANGIKWHQKLQ